MIIYIRHSERLDSKDKLKWKRSKRYKENPEDTPITKEGIKIAEKKTNIILEKMKDIDYIYSSPLTRCIETALVIKKNIKKKLKKDIKIRIEYGLTEQRFKSIELNNGKFKYTNKKYLDNKLKLSNIINKHGNHFDNEYKSMYKFEDIDFDEEQLSFFNKSVKIYKKINSLKKNSIVCTHSWVIYAVYSYLIKNLDWTNYDLITKNYCSMLIKDKKKVNILND